MRAHTYELEESNVKLKLTLCDTVGFGDQVNKEESFGPVVDYVDSQFEAYLQGKWVNRWMLNAQLWFTFYMIAFHIDFDNNSSCLTSFRGIKDQAQSVGFSWFKGTCLLIFHHS